MRLKNLVSWKMLVITLALKIIPVYAQAYMSSSGEETYTPQKRISPANNTTGIRPEKENGPALKIKSRRSRRRAIFLERSPQTVRGTSSNKKVTFSAMDFSGKIVVSFVLNEKEFRFVYGFIDLKEDDLESIQLIPDSTGQNTKTADDNAILLSLLMELRRDLNMLYPLENGILSSLDFLVGMFPKDEPFDKMEFNETGLQGATEERGKTEIVKPKKYTSICNERGKARTGTFNSDDGRVYNQTVIVGDPATECWGRCGIACFQLGQSMKRQYTDQCLAHDLCAGHFGGNFGNCTNEFSAAQYGYRKAGNCAFRVIGTWRFKFDWWCTGASSTVMITYFSDHRFVSSLGQVGAWELNGNQIIRSYNGTREKYIGTIDDPNMETTGSIIYDGIKAGCFTDTYLVARAS